MGKLIIVANRLPYCLTDAGTLERSAGGLASALGPLHERDGNYWIGAADVAVGQSKPKHVEEYDEVFAARGCIPVHLSRGEYRSYYEGFSNSTIWPLFHDFPTYARFDEHTWQSYRAVNEKFCDAVCSVAAPDDVIWVQDYQLMLLPAMLRQRISSAQIGFFLHIPFPDYERYRMLPWRSQILEGLLGADLIGFHTYDYVRHFLSSCRRITGHENQYGFMIVDDHAAQADVFPLGIDYSRFADIGHGLENTANGASLHEGGPTDAEGTALRRMLSVERLDYSKGIPQLLRAYEAFLQQRPEWIGRVELTLVAVPSREHVASYKRLKTEVDGLVGHLNGSFAVPGWTPVRYYYRSFPLDQLCRAYAESDVMLVTPLRDGMNLVAKEYLAVHDGRDGVLVLSEMAGAAGELNDAVMVNPFDADALAQAMEQALDMPQAEQLSRNSLMQRRLKDYTSEKWAREFLHALDRAKVQQDALTGRRIVARIRDKLVESYRSAHRRAIVLDYDGTLVPFVSNPAAARPDRQLTDLIAKIAADPANDVAIVSGRDKASLDRWFGTLPVSMIAEHGVWSREPGDADWTLNTPTDDAWKDRIRPSLQSYVDRTPGSSLEEKDRSLVWHYRSCNVELAERRVAEMRNDLAETALDMGLQMADGNKIVEFKSADINKGSAAYRWLGDASYDFVFVAGDDLTDEDMFHAAPEEAWSVKVGASLTRARFSVRDCRELRTLLEHLGT
jgi:trehalose 6-phosphate synthase/phosphatase